MPNDTPDPRLFVQHQVVTGLIGGVADCIQEICNAPREPDEQWQFHVQALVQSLVDSLHVILVNLTNDVPIEDLRRVAMMVQPTAEQEVELEALKRKHLFRLEVIQGGKSGDDYEH